MLGELVNIPTDTLIDMLFVILDGGVLLTAGDVAEIEQIQRELQKREARINTGVLELSTSLGTIN